MSDEQANAFLRRVGADPDLQRRLATCDARAAAELGRQHGFDVAVADFTRYKARATSWRLSDEELAVVADWQAADQPYWWQHIWPAAGLQ